MSDLASYVDRSVSVVTNDGRYIVGTLKGFDQTTNIILSNSTERIFSLDEGMEIMELGLYVIRGDNIAVIGELDPELDKQIQWDDVKAEPFSPLKH